MCDINKDLIFVPTEFPFLFNSVGGTNSEGIAAFLCWFHKAVIWLAPPNDCFDDHINATLVCVIQNSSCEVGILLSSDLWCISSSC